MIRHCPECRGPLEVRDGLARCTVHGGEYKILFWREVQAQPSLSELLGCPARTAFAEISETSETPAAVAEEDPSSPPGVPPPLPVLPSPPLPPPLPLPGERTQAWCVTHPDFPALFVCHRCQAPICEVCSFPQPDGGRLCPVCATRQTAGTAFHAGASAVTLAVQNRQCAQHPHVPASQICHLCGAPVCATCDFLLPGDFHVCPTCAMTPHTRLSPARKVALLASYALAVWSTLEMAGLFTGFLHGWGHETEVVLGAWLMLLMVTPSTAGLALGSGLLAHHIHGRATRLAIYLAAIWNGLAIIFYVGLVLMKMAKP